MGSQLRFVEVKLTPVQAQAWNETKTALIWQAPGFAHIFYSLLNLKKDDGVLFWTRSIPTMCTDGRAIAANPDFFFGLALQYRVFGVCHEIAHAMFNHCEVGYQLQRSGKIQVYRAGNWIKLPYIHLIGNKAMDYVINDLLVESKIGKCHKNWLHDTDIGTHANSWVEVYERLFAQQEEPDEPEDGEEGEEGEEGEAGEGPTRPGDQPSEGDEEGEEGEEGEAGEGPTRPGDQPSEGDEEGEGEGEGDPDDQETEGDGESGGKAKNGTQKPPKGKSGGNQGGKIPEQTRDPGQFDDHLAPGTIEGKDPEECKTNEIQWQEAIASAMEIARAQGKLPGCMEQFFTTFLEPKVTWQDEIRGELARKVGSGGYDFRRAHRRLIVRDIYAPSQSGHGCDTIVVKIDTSGSVFAVKHLLDRWFAEMSGIISEVHPRRLIVIEADDIVQKVTEVEDEMDLLEYRATPSKGGGGTSFIPSFKYLEDEQIVPDAVVYLTDMWGDFPTEEPPYPVIWGSITPKDQHEEPPFGKVVYIPTDGTA
jgi:predicted metal-dependent peptidase